MSKARSLQHVLDRAKRDLPSALPADFTDQVMDQVRSNSAANGSASTRPLHLALMAAAIVITASLINLLAHHREHDSQPPPLAIFGGQPAGFELELP